MSIAPRTRLPPLSSLASRLSWLSPTVVVALLLLAYLGLTLTRHNGDPLAFATLGAGFLNGEPLADGSYDGQFAYWIALNPRPSAAGPQLDVPAYRYQRVLYPLLAWALALGQTALVPWTLVGISFVAQVVLTALVERWLLLHG